MFSQSFEIGENTLQHLENAEIARDTGGAVASDQDVIEESPTSTSKTTFRSFSSNHRSRLRSMRPNKRTDKFNRSKSDSALNTSTSTANPKSNNGNTAGNQGNDDYSALFKCSMDFELNLAAAATQQKLPTQNGNLSQFFKFDFAVDSNSMFDSSQSAIAKSVLEQPISSDDIDNFSIDNWDECDDFKATAEPPMISSVINETAVGHKTLAINADMFDVSDFIDDLTIDEETKIICDQPISIEDMENLSIVDWDDCDAFNNNDDNLPQLPAVHKQMTIEDVAALGLDNVTFTQDFLQAGQQDLNKSEAISSFVERELLSCRRAMPTNSIECLSEVSNISTFIVTGNSTKISDIVLNISDSSEPESEPYNVAKEDSHTMNCRSVTVVREKDDHNIIEVAPVETVLAANLNSIRNWGLPETVVNEYRKKKIETMFDWQCQCLSNRKVLFDSANLVYSAPTSAGKTLVSEILMIKNVLEKKKKALLIMPFISVVREKLFYLQELLSSSGVNVDGYFGGYTPPRGIDNTHIAVCTIEKANAIVNRLLEQNKLHVIGCIVVDEIHLISDPGRGYILELLLTKCEYVSRLTGHHIQIITMSATLPNLHLLTKWLKAEFFSTDFRPVELREMIKVGNVIYGNDLKVIRRLDNWNTEEFPKDQDAVGQLCVETMCEGGAVIVFCPSKDWCESLSHHLAGFVYNVGKSKTEVGNKLRQQLDMAKIGELKLQFKNCPSGLDSVLEKTVSYGCAFHHAGLTTDERDIIESGFKIGALKIIVATSTLSSGVNLPARRVIIRSPLFGGKPMNALTYKQMIGRAGRTGRDTLGESILICVEANKHTGKDLVCAQLKPLTSCLATDNYVHLKRAILEIIAAGVCTTVRGLEQFVNATLLASEQEQPFRYEAKNELANKSVKNQSLSNLENLASKSNDQPSEQTANDSDRNPIAACMQFLIAYEFVRLQLNDETNEMNYVPTRLGRACLASSMPPSDGFLLFSELQKSRQCFVLESELHAIYLVTPFSVCYQMQDIDWLAYLDMWEKLSAPMRRVGELVGIRESFLVKAMRNHKLDYKQLQIHKRFYTALALQELVNEQHVTLVAHRYKCSRGLLQSLQQMASTFAGIVTSFCRALNWNMLALIIGQFQERLYFGIHQDLIDLMRIANLTNQRARALFDGGFRTLIDLANGNVFEIETVLYNSLSFDMVNLEKDNGDQNADALRNQVRHLYVTGKSGLTINEIARLLIDDARQYLEQEIGISGGIKWSNDDRSITVSDKAIACQSIEPILSANKSAHLAPMPNIVDSEDMFGEVSGYPTDNINTIDSAENRVHQSNVKDHTENVLKNIVNIRKEPKTKRKLESPAQSNILAKISKPSGQQSHHFNDNDDDSIDFTTEMVDVAGNASQLNSSHVLSAVKSSSTSEHLEKLEIINVFASKEFFEKFTHVLSEQLTISISVGIEKCTKSRPVIGENLLINQHATTNVPANNFRFDEHFYLACITVSVGSNCAYFLNLQNDNTDTEISVKRKIEFVREILQQANRTIRLYNVKEQLKIVCRTIGLTVDLVAAKLEDAKVADWLLQPEMEKSLSEMIEQYAPECVGISKFGGLCCRNGSFGLNSSSSVGSKIRTAVECCVVGPILTGQIENLDRIGNGNFLKAFYENEMPIQRSLIQMELIGFPVNYDELRKTTDSISTLMQTLQKRIYQLHGKRFNIASPSEVAKVLGLYNGTTNAKPSKVSTAKQALEKILNPLSNLIVQHRKLEAIQSKTLQPLLRMNSANQNRINGNSITFTSTGRITMHEPNLQNVARDFIVKIDSFTENVSCRSAFKVASKRMLVSADFCQLELRILTHLSEDPKLISIMKLKQDIFRTIAAKWYRLADDEVSEAQRNNTKQICYGIIYGMGTKSMADNLKCSEDDARTHLESFHATYPGIRTYIEKVIKFVHKEGYVETLSGRRRYFSSANTNDRGRRAQIERQAVNTIVQGSAADISKCAIIRMERNIRKYANDIKVNLPDDKLSSVDLVLHIHDELMYECPANKARQIAKILKLSMENCAKLSVPLMVKVKTGDSWGSLMDCDT